ncbi:PepSY-like domain-containing protein [Flavobacterium hungaricum]|nr:hypothetical protein [Flavobacterium hungaricum]
MSQAGILVPPEVVTTAFEKQYPKKSAYWSIEYSSNSSDVYFEAKFNTDAKAKGYALFDQKGNFVSYKEQVSNKVLPKTALDYLIKNYPAKTVSKAKTKSKSKAKAKTTVVTSSATEFFSVVDAKGQNRYEVKVQKEGKTYNVIFDSIGEFVKRSQIQ